MFFFGGGVGGWGGVEREREREKEREKEARRRFFVIFFLKKNRFFFLPSFFLLPLLPHCILHFALSSQQREREAENTPEEKDGVNASDFILSHEESYFFIFFFWVFLSLSPLSLFSSPSLSIPSMFIVRTRCFM